MRKKDAKENKAPTPLQKALAFGVLLLLCALIYLFVSLAEQHQTQTIAYTAPPVAPTPTATPKPTLPPGVSAEVFITRLEEAGFLLLEEGDGAYSMQYQANAPEDALVLYAANGYVQGFSLTLKETAGKKISSPKGEISEYLSEKHTQIIEDQSRRISAYLPVLLSALTEDDTFPRSTALIWADSAASVLGSGKPVSESKHGISFAALRTEEERLLLSADLL